MISNGEHPLVSIVILNYFHPEVINVCLSTLEMTEGVTYEVIVVDNGSDAATVEELQRHKREHRIDTLVLEPTNHMFSEGNNIGVRNANPESEYILLLNSDVGFLRPDWLSKMLQWMDGTIQVHPSVWGLKPTVPKGGELDIVSIGWSHDATVLPGNVRPEGWCLLMRKNLWKEMSPDFPFLYGFEEMIAGVVREGARCGVTSQYAKYLVHKEGGSGKGREVISKRVPDIPGWFNGLEIESLDFTLGPEEHSSYMSW